MGDYVKPKRILRANNVLTTDLLNDQLLPVAEAASSINCHNIAYNSITKDMISTGAVYSMEYADVTGETVEDGHFAGGSAFPSVPIGTTGFVEVPNNGSWERCTESALTIQSSSEVLVVFASAQYIWHTFGTGTDNHLLGKGTSCGVMLSLMVGDIQYDMSGFVDTLYAPPLPVRAGIQRSTGSRLPGPVDRFQAPCGACGPELFPVFMMAVVPVTPGQQTATINAKRINTKEESAFETGDVVEVTQQQVFILRIPWRASASDTSDGVTITPFESEDIFSAEAIGTDRVTATRTKLNNVTAGMLGRGALLSDHLPQALHSAAESHQGTVGTGTTVAMSTYYYTEYADTASTHWYLSTTAANAALLTTERLGLFIIGTVNVRGLNCGQTADFFLAIALFYRVPSGAYVKLPESERYVNSFSWYSTDTEEYHEEVVVNVMAFVDYRTSAPTAGTHAFKVGVCIGSMSDVTPASQTASVGAMTVDVLALNAWG